MRCNRTGWVEFRTWLSGHSMIYWVLSPIISSITGLITWINSIVSKIERVKHDKNEGINQGIACEIVWLAMAPMSTKCLFDITVHVVWMVRCHGGVIRGRRSVTCATEPSRCQAPGYDLWPVRDAAVSWLTDSVTVTDHSTAWHYTTVLNYRLLPFNFQTKIVRRVLTVIMFFSSIFFFWYVT